MFSERIYHKIFDHSEELRVVVIVGVQLLAASVCSDDSQREGRIDIEVFVEPAYSAVLCDHIVYEDRLNIVRPSRHHRYAALACQPFGIGERDTCNACSVSARVDTDNEATTMVVGVELSIKSPHYLHRLWVVGVWVQYRKPRRQQPRIRQLPIEIDNTLRHRQVCLVVVHYYYKKGFRWTFYYFVVYMIFSVSI